MHLPPVPIRLHRPLACLSLALMCLFTWVFTHTWALGWHLRQTSAPMVLPVAEAFDEDQVAKRLQAALAAGQDPAELLLDRQGGLDQRVRAMAGYVACAAGDYRLLVVQGLARNGTLLGNLHRWGVPSGVLDALVPLAPERWLADMKALLLVFAAAPLALALWLQLLPSLRWRLPQALRPWLRATVPDASDLLLLTAVTGLLGLGLVVQIAHTPFGLLEQPGLHPVDPALNHLRSLLKVLLLPAVLASLNLAALEAPRWWKGNLLELLAAVLLLASLGFQVAGAAMNSQQFLGFRGAIGLLAAVPLAAACLGARMSKHLDPSLKDLGSRWARCGRTVAGLAAVLLPLVVTAICLVAPNSDRVKDRGPIIGLGFMLATTLGMLVLPALTSFRDRFQKALLPLVLCSSVLLVASPWLYVRWSVARGRQAKAAAVQPSALRASLLEGRFQGLDFTAPQARYFSEPIRSQWELVAGSLRGQGTVPIQGPTNAAKDFPYSILAGAGGYLGLLAAAALLLLFLAQALRRAEQTRAETGSAVPYLAASTGVGVLAISVQSMSGSFSLFPSSGVVAPFLSYSGAGLAAYLLLVGLMLAGTPGRPAPKAASPWAAWPSLKLQALAVLLLLGVVLSGTAVLLGQRRTILAASVVNPAPSDPLNVEAVSAPHLHRLAQELENSPARGRLRDRHRLSLEGPEALAAGLGPLLGGRRIRPNAFQSSLFRDALPTLVGCEAFFDQRTFNEGKVWLGRNLPAARLTPREVALTAFYFGGQPRPQDVEATLDLKLQTLLMATLQAKLAALSLKGEAMLMDPGTGALLAAALYKPAKVLAAERAKGGDPVEAALFTTAFLDRRPGSTWKVAVDFVALSEGVVTQDQPFLCQNSVTLADGSVIKGKCKHFTGVGEPVQKPHGLLPNHTAAMAKSCNNYRIWLMSKLVARLTPTALAERFSRLGLPVQPRDFATPNDWIYLAFGEGRAKANPVSLGRLTSHVYQAAHGGVAQAQSPGWDFERSGWGPRAIAWSSTAAERRAGAVVLEGMRAAAAPGGSAYGGLGKALPASLPIYAKTGTSQLTAKRVQGYTATLIVLAELPQGPLLLVVRLLDGDLENLSGRGCAGIAADFFNRLLNSAGPAQVEARR